MQDENKHFLNLIDRKVLFLQGAKDIESFDDKSIMVVTDKGMLNIKGEDLHIKSINLEEEKLEVTGYISLMAFNDGKGKAAKKSGQGLLKRILK